MNKKEKVNLIQSYFDELLPNAQCELNYTHDYELLIAVMLSAQTTDKSVNRITSVLFSKYPTLDSLYKAEESDIFSIIKSIGLAKNKTKNLLGIVKLLVENYDSKLPRTRDELTLFPGVGRKTANVVRCELFKEPEFPVDTHIERISKRLNLAKEDDTVLDVELKLRKAFNQDKYILLHHQFIHFGRYYCKAKNPSCNDCKLKDICKYFKS